MDGNAAVVAYSSLDGDLDKSLGWHLLITQSQRKSTEEVVQNLLISLAGGILVVVVGVLVSGMVITNSVSTPLGKLTKKGP